ncbi:MAG: hypothetical protein Q8L86_17700 [Vicinamibacterales bacterium]|nr:hypothetical protein [Vicinamibacterales bacterium]
MTRLPLRFLVIVLALAATGGLGYRAFRIDLSIGATLDATRRAEQAVAATRLTLAGLDATLRSFVAPGQRPRVWAEEADRQLNLVREQLIALESAAPAGGDHPIDGALDRVDQLAASAGRIRSYVEGDQGLLASDIVFNEARGLVAGLDEQVARAGSLERGRQAAALSSLRQEQGLVVGGSIAVWLFAAILLLPAGRATQPASPEATAAHATFGDLGTGAARAPEAPAASNAARGAAAPAAAAPAALVSAAALCTDLARVTDGTEVTRLLERAAEVLDASGVIVWVAGPTGAELFAAGSHGYDERMFARIGAIHRDAANLTAAAFREGALRTSAALDSSGAAIAVPLIGPSGVVGVLSAELRASVDLSPSASALATIVAAQLATLVGSLPSAAGDEAPPAQQANA